MAHDRCSNLAPLRFPSRPVNSSEMVACELGRHRTTFSRHAARITAADSSSISQYSQPDGTARKTRVCRRFGPSRLTLGRSQPCVACMVYRTSVCARPGHTPDSILVCMSSKQWWGVDQTDTERVLTFYMNLKPPPPSDSPLPRDSRRTVGDVPTAHGEVETPRPVSVLEKPPWCPRQSCGSG